MLPAGLALYDTQGKLSLPDPQGHQRQERERDAKSPPDVDDPIKPVNQHTEAGASMTRPSTWRADAGTRNLTLGDEPATNQHRTGQKYRAHTLPTMAPV